jgi:hypothetical protein
MEDGVTSSKRSSGGCWCLNHLETKALLNAEAAQLLAISIRQVRLLRTAYRDRGPAALHLG